MSYFTLMHVNTKTGVENSANVRTERIDDLVRLINAFADDDPSFDPYGSVYFKVPYGTLSVIPFEEA